MKEVLRLMKRGKNMNYNFETTVPRYGVGSSKWDELQALWPQADADVIPFSMADMEFELAPEIKAGLKEFIDTTILGYACPTDKYKQVVCNWQKTRNNWEARPEWILLTHGVVDAFFEAIKCYTKENEGVILFTPVYYPMYNAISRNKRVLRDCPLVKNGSTYDIDFALLEQYAQEPTTKLLILCSPHNPCGRVWKKEELEHIGQICNANGVLVISDEIHSDLLMPGFHHTVYAALNKECEQNCIIMTAPSKTFNLAGVQTSTIFIPNEKLRQLFYAEQQTGVNVPRLNSLGYAACQIAYTECTNWLEECLQVINTNKNLVVSFLALHFPQIEVCDMQATYLLWMNWRGLGLTYQELEHLNRTKAQLFFDEGYVFGGPGQGFERWNLACPTRYVQAALDRMLKTYTRYAK